MFTFEHSNERYYIPETIFGHSVGKSDARAGFSLPLAGNPISRLLLGILRDAVTHTHKHIRGAEL